MPTLLAETRLFASRIGSVRSLLLHLILLAVFGIGIPRLKAAYFLDPQVLGAYACLGLLFAGPATAQMFPDSTSSFPQAKARTLIGVLYGELVVLLLLALGIGTVNLRPPVPTPDWTALARSLTFGLAASALVSSTAALLTVRFSPRVALTCLRLIFFALILLFFYRGPSLPELGLTAAAACFALSGLLVALLKFASLTA
jgi:hypothetical protein